MSDSNSQKGAETKSSQNEDETGANRSSDIENFDKTVAVLPIVKTDSSAKEIVVNIDNFTENFGRNDENKAFSVFGFDRNQPPTWVMYQGMPPEPIGEPLAYDSSRNSFVRLVFIIVLIMLLITSAFVALVMFQSTLREIFQEYGLFFAIPAMIVMVGMSYVVACSQCARVPPCNIIVLVVAVICMSLICAYMSVRFKTQIVLFAVIATSVVVIVCILIACSSFDFTRFLLYIVVVAAAVGAVGMIIMIVMLVTGTYMKIVHLIILLVSTVVQSVVLIMELQMILGGRAVELSEDDYALAAYMLYTSIVDMFLKLLQIIGIFDSF